MDAVKKFLKSVARYQFWILSVLVLIGSMAVFIVTKLSLDKLIATRVTALDEAHKKVTAISGAVSTHPNSHSHRELDKLVNVLSDEVKAAWELQYKLQSPLLVWPENAFPMNKQAIDIFRSLRPIEQYVEFPIPPNTPQINKITVQDRSVFRRYIAPQFANVSKIIGTEWKASIESMAAGGMGGYGMAGGEMGMGMGSSGAEGGYGSEGGFGGGGYGMGAGVGIPESKDLVRWSKDSQQQLLLQILPWYHRKDPPTVLDIYYTQEDMWLLTGIMEIIRATNAGAVENFQTKVREIEWIRMGRHANRDAGSLTIGPRMPAGGMGMGGEGGEGSEMGMGMGMETESSGGPPGMMEGEGGSEMGMGMMGEGGMMAASVDPADRRYLSFAPESEFSPVTGVQLRENIKNINAGNAVDAVARRVPIRMRLKIDPNHLSTLIAECGNANLMLEVYQVRLNTPAATTMGGGGYGGGYGGGGGKGMGMDMGGEGAGMGGGEMESGSMGMGMGGEYGGSEMGGGSYGGGYGMPGGATGASTNKAMSEVPVEIFGLIYLYNPVNMGPLVEAVEIPATEPSVATPAVPTAPTGAPATPASEPTPAANENTVVPSEVAPANPSPETNAAPVNPTEPTNPPEPSAVGNESPATTGTAPSVTPPVPPNVTPTNATTGTQ